MCLIKMIDRAIKKNAALKLDDKTFDQVVKIQGTDFDRKRKISEQERVYLKKLFLENTSIKDLCELTGRAYTTIRYIVDDNWRSAFNEKRSGKHTGITTMDFANRVAYKRDLVKKGNIIFK